VSYGINSTQPSYYYNINAYNNTIYNNKVGLTIGILPSDSPHHYINGLSIENNLMANNGEHVLWDNQQDHTNTIFDNNYYDTLIANLNAYYGTNYVVGGDPLFIDPANDNFNLQLNSPAIGYGAHPYPMFCDFIYRQ
jgi:hypothetical protein